MARVKPSENPEGQKVLICEDRKKRQALFIAKYPYAIMVNNSRDCINQLRDNGPWDMVFLDHNLGRGDLGEDDNGDAITSWVKINRPRVRQFIIHSTSAVEGLLMMWRLRKESHYMADYVPFDKKTWVRDF